jgi:hypothetical protein
MSVKNERSFSPPTELSQGGSSTGRHDGITAIRSKGELPAFPRPRLTLDTITRSMNQQDKAATNAAAAALRERTGWY